MLFRFQKNEVKFLSRKYLYKFKKLAAFYSNTDQVLIMKIEEFTKDSTIHQVDIWNTFTSMLSKEIGYSNFELQLIYLKMFSTYTVVKNMYGEYEKIYKAPELMNLKEFQHFFELCKNHAFEFLNFNF